MPPSPIHNESFTVPALECDFQNRWKPACVLPPAALKARLPDPPDLVGLDEPLEKLNPPTGLEPRGEVTVSYNAIDLLGHVNNTCYVEWITDCFPFEHHCTR